MATFQQVMELEQVPKRRQLIQSKVEEYSIRMAQLREILAKQRFEVAIGIDEQVRCPALPWYPPLRLGSMCSS